MIFSFLVFPIVTACKPNPSCRIVSFIYAILQGKPDFNFFAMISMPPSSLVIAVWVLQDA
jgi:hypothetical protein